MKDFKENNRTWSLFVDPDEFISFNSDCSSDSKSSRHSKERRLPSNLASTTIVEYIAENNEIFSKHSCIVLPRIQYSSKEESDKKVLNKQMPHGFKARNFTTLSQFSHALKFYRKENYESKWILGKSMIDVSRINDAIVVNAHMIHRDCKFPNTMFPLRINHYNRKYEAFVARTDFHIDTQKFLDRNKDANCVTHETQGWLLQFVKSVGATQAKKLVESVGCIKNYTDPNYVPRDCRFYSPGSNCTMLNVEDLNELKL